ncbi:MAG TPA: sugar phosphate isomerase/epimerase [Acidimicrobiia bacterium]|nr:sugar phosphate isomerase/epimerase [Acidimicrobiia bacterium]
MHPRVCVSAISSFTNTLDDDVALWERHAVTTVGVSVAKLDRAGWQPGIDRIAGAHLRVANLIGLGPFTLDDPSQWVNQQQRLLRALDAAVQLDAECLVFTTGPAGALAWDDAADALDAATGPVRAEARRLGIPFALEHTNSLRVDVGFVHTLRDVVDLARRLDVGVCMEINACWAERALHRTIADHIDAITLVQVSDYAIGTFTTPARLVPGDGDIPLDRILGALLDAGYTGVFDLELIGPAIEAEGYDTAVPRAVDALGTLLSSLGA